MAEKSPRPEAEEDAEEEGEEAAEAPVRAVKGKGEKKEKREEKAPESPPEEDLSQDSLPSEPSSTSPAYPRVMPVHPSVSPAPYAPEPPGAYCPSVSGVNLFANDGSFLEMFKKKMEATGSKEETKEPEEKKPEPDKRKPISFVGKRRGGAKLALKTGIVAKKQKTEEEEIMSHKGGAWAQYMAEVKKYKAHQCSDDDKTRPLVK
ncbi:telomerase RNA component interacting RNase [Hyla sarda]|uniref:telomerase RNA component interacting RNase n=1 Tax=Hyla sarda TaxID=327740 RepID=UPI0024C42AB6|nr:telomerase RNA component interacting RNase [Hyla sarda]